MADDPKKKYPLPKFHFQVDWQGTLFQFTEVTGLDFETQVIEYRHGASITYNKTKQPGLTKFSDIVLKRGTFNGNYEAYKIWTSGSMFQTGKGSNGDLRSNSVSISLLGEDHKPVITWQLENAWPSKVQSTDLKADGNEVAIETMTLVHEGLSIQIT